jgi:hypothetical protein
MQRDTIVNEVPPDARPINGLGTDPAQGQTTVSLRPVAFSAETIWQSPCFWMVVGSALTLFAVYTLRKKL